MLATMASHFQCLGFALSPETSGEEDVLSMVARVCDAGETVPSPEGYLTFRWTDGEATGAYVVLALDPDSGEAALQCFTPVFQSGLVRRARVQRALPDADCPFCDHLQVLILPPGGGAPWPLLLEVKDPSWSRDLDLRGAEVSLEVAVLAQHVRVFENAAALAKDGPPDRAAECFLALGLEERPPVPRAELAGIVESARLLVNPLGGGSYVHAVVRAGGGTWDVLAAKDDLPTIPVPGQILLATGSLVGRILENP
jgi:hypothetical protein